MDKKEIVRLTAVTLCALNASKSGCPESHLYLAVEMDMEKFAILRHVLVKFGWIAISGNWVEITPSGRELAKDMEDSLANAVQKGVE